jgi:excisionase family DNA binding protein
MRAYSPRDLAEEWGCSARHVQKLIEAKKLRAFRLGEKMLRIPVEAVEEFLKRNSTTTQDSMEYLKQCNSTRSENYGESSVSSITTKAENDTVTGLAPATRLRLRNLRRRAGRN